MDAKLKAILANWRDLNESLHELNEDQVRMMLDWELEHEWRVTVVERLHQRYNALRVKREREELMARNKGG